MPESITRLLESGRRLRMRRRVVTGVVMALGSGGAVLAALAGITHVWFAPWAEPAGWAIIGLLVGAAVVAGISRRQTDLGVAQTLDAALDGKDRLTTAVELEGRGGGLAVMERRQVEATVRWAEHRDLGPLRSPWPSPVVIRLSALAVAAGAVLTFTPSVTDRVAEERRAQTEAIAAEADALEALAESSPEPVAGRLEELAEDLRELETTDEALNRLNEAQEALRADIQPGDLARRTALAGMRQRLEQAGLSEGRAASEALEALAATVPSMTGAEALRAAQQLHDRADDFAGVSPEVAEALEGAAGALDALGTGLGDAQAAADAVAAAADAVAAAENAADASAAAAEAAAAAGAAAERLEGQGQGQSQSQGQGQGRGQGQGQGGGGGGGQGGAGSGAGSTQGGTGSGTVSGSGGDEDPWRDPARSTVFDPVVSGIGDQVKVDVEGGGDGETTGSVSGNGIENLPLTPYADRFAEYRDTALDAIGRGAVPASVEGIVRAYFLELEP